MCRRNLIRLAGIAVLLFLIGSLTAQRGWGRNTNAPPPPEWLPKNPDSEFAFSRMVFFSEGPRYNWYAGWTTDYPAADVHLIQGLDNKSRINAHQQPLVMPINNPRLFQYPST